jgi:hypothetical protein
MRGIADGLSGLTLVVARVFQANLGVAGAGQ